MVTYLKTMKRFIAMRAAEFIYRLLVLLSVPADHDIAAVIQDIIFSS